jgi:hypothetical protein
MKRLAIPGAAMAVFLVLLLLAAAAQAKVSLLQISSDPFTNPTSQHATQVEPDSLAAGSTIVSAFQSGRFFGGGASGIGWATSADGGVTWTAGFLPALTKFEGAGPYDRATDPAVGYDGAHGVWLIASLALHEATGVWDVLVSRSTDGVAWSSPVTVALGPPHGGLDKPWIACDSTASSPFYGQCYVQWTDFPGNCSQHVEVSVSTDGGLTWGSVQTPANSASATAGQPVVLSNGTVVVPLAGGCNQNSLKAMRSIDGGATWSSIAPITSIHRHKVAGGLRGGSYVAPSAEVDGSGKVYVSWQDCRFRRNCSSNDIVFSTSTDGVTWSPVRRVPIDPVASSVDHFIPGLAVDRATSGASAHLGLTYYYYPDANCDASTCQLDVGFISSTNGGAT